jgi:hypothetical protein
MLTLRRWACLPQSAALPEIVVSFSREESKGRATFAGYAWLNISAKSARMEQSFSPDGGKTWEVHGICELSR